MMKVKVQEQNYDDVLNMDQTQIPHSNHASKILVVKGKKTAHARASTTDTKCVTLAATITSKQKMLAPFLIFKGQPTGCIAMYEFVTYPDAGKYACKDKVWMDGLKMHK